MPNFNQRLFFKELNKYLGNITRKYENVQYRRLRSKKDSKNYYATYVLLSHSQILEPGVTCLKSVVGCLIDLMLANKPKGFHRTNLIETGISDCHKLILPFFKPYFKRIPAKITEYHNYSKFNAAVFIHELD